MLLRLLHGLAAAALLAAVALAQTIHVPNRVLHEGESIDIGFSDPNRANSFVIVRVDNGDASDPDFDYVEIWLDGSGRGRRSYTIPVGWWVAQFNGGQAKQVTRAVAP